MPKYVISCFSHYESTVFWVDCEQSPLLFIMEALFCNNSKFASPTLNTQRLGHLVPSSTCITNKVGMWQNYVLKPWWCQRDLCGRENSKIYMRPSRIAYCAVCTKANYETWFVTENIVSNLSFFKVHLEGSLILSIHNF